MSGRPTGVRRRGGTDPTTLTPDDLVPVDQNRTVPSTRLERRIWRDFPEPGSADGVLGLLAALPGRAGYDPEIFGSERVQAAVVLLAGGDLGGLRKALQLAVSDWRDLLVAAGLADGDWPVRLDRELGPPVPPSDGRSG
jgi:hypothetical protein